MEDGGRIIAEIRMEIREIKANTEELKAATEEQKAATRELKASRERDAAFARQLAGIARDQSRAMAQSRREFRALWLGHERWLKRHEVSPQTHWKSISRLTR